VTEGAAEKSDQERIAPAARPPRFAAGALTLATLLALALSFAGIFQHELWTPDEPREAEIGREMYAAGGSAMPTLGGEPFLEKPPLFVWTMAASFSTFGVSAAAARVPAALFSAAALLAAFVLGRRAAGNAAGYLAIVVLATTSEFWSVSHRSINDTALAAFVAWTHLCLLRAWERRRNAGGRAFDWIAAGVLTGLAFLTKGVIGPVLALAPPLLAIFLLGERRFALGLALRAGSASLAAIALFGAPWALALARHPGGFGNVYECVVAQVLARSLGGNERISGHTHWPGYYLLQFPLSCAPWIVAAPAMFASSVLRRGESAALLRRCAVTLFAGVVLLSIPSGKRGSYLVPLFPVLAALVGAWLAQARAEVAIERVTARFLIGVVALAALLLALFAGAVQWLHPVDRRGELNGLYSAELTSVRWGLVFAGIVTAAVALRAMKRTAAGSARPLGHAVALPLLLLLLTSHLLVRPFLEPVKGLKAGALAVARSVPESEPLLAFAPDETTLAVVPFYGGRLVIELPRDGLLAEMERRGARHLLVMEDGFGRLPEEARARLKPVRTIEFTPTRSLQLLEVVP
jgi:4-amino-4-deoxy-L-arabinose transferase-like glycosyltransferase